MPRAPTRLAVCLPNTKIWCPWPCRNRRPKTINSSIGASGRPARWFRNPPEALEFGETAGVPGFPNFSPACYDRAEPSTAEDHMRAICPTNRLTVLGVVLAVMGCTPTALPFQARNSKDVASYGYSDAKLDATHYTVAYTDKNAESAGAF